VLKLLLVNYVFLNNFSDVLKCLAVSVPFDVLWSVWRINGHLFQNRNVLSVPSHLINRFSDSLK